MGRVQHYLIFFTFKYGYNWLSSQTEQPDKRRRPQKCLYHSDGVKTFNGSYGRHCVHNCSGCSPPKVVWESDRGPKISSGIHHNICGRIQGQLESGSLLWRDKKITFGHQRRWYIWQKPKTSDLYQCGDSWRPGGTCLIFFCQANYH